MSVWGKLGGAGAGLALGGPIGALIGAFAGHYLVDREGAPLGPPPREIVLLTGLVALCAKMAKADGVVLDAEMAAFERVVIVPPSERARVQGLFRLAQGTTTGFESYAKQLARVFADEPGLLDDVLDGLFLVAKADGAIHDAELAYLATVAAIFGRDPASFELQVARHARLPHDPWRVLGVDRAMSDDALKARHRALVRDHHPDREIARGLPPEAVRIATDRLAAINAAWDLVARERGLR